METGDLAALAARIVAGMATGVGQAVTEAVSALVRARLGGSEHGARALADNDVAALSSAIETELAADPAFEGRLNTALTVTHTQNTGGVNVTGSTLKRSQIALGPLSITTNNNNRTSLAGLAVVLLALIAFAVFGAVHLFAGDDPPADAPGPGGVAGARPGGGSGGPGADAGKETAGDRKKAVAFVPEALGTLIVPDIGAMPAGWSLVSPAKVDRLDGSCDPSPACERAPYRVEADFGAPTGTGGTGGAAGTRGIGIEVFPTQDAEAATTITTWETGPGHGWTTTSFPPVGDNTSALAQGTALALKFRVGAVCVRVTGHGVDTTMLETVARTVAERAQQAQNGERPTATVHSG